MYIYHFSKILLSLYVALVPATESQSSCLTAPADLHFLLDTSGSVGERDFLKVKSFVENFARSFVIGPNNVQVGVTTFSSRVHPQFFMNKFTSVVMLNAAIRSVPYTNGETNTADAITWVDQHAFTKAAGDRDQVQNILIIITDGKSNVPQLTAAAAIKLHDHHIKTFAIGVGANVDLHELETLASDHQHVFTVDNFDALHSLQTELNNATCNVRLTTKTAHPTTKILHPTTRILLHPTTTIVHHTDTLVLSTTKIVPTNFCASHPCQNSGRCMHDDDGYVCLCSGGFTGTNCEHDICSTHPCQNSGRCLEDSDGYVCMCGAYFTGKNCETGKR